MINKQKYDHYRKQLNDVNLNNYDAIACFYLSIIGNILLDISEQLEKHMESKDD